MSEAPSNVTPQPQQSSPTSSSESSVSQPITESKEPTKEAIVKSLVEHGSKKYQDKKQTTETVKSEEKKPETKQETKQDAKPENSQPKKLDSDKTKPDDKKTDIEGDPKLATRIAKIADAENKARIATENLTKERATFNAEKEQFKGNVAEWQKFTTTFPEDPVRALKELGLKDEHMEALYWRLNADVLQRTKDGKPTLTEADVDRRAAEIAEKKFRELQEQHGQQSQKQFDAAMEAAQKQYVGKVAAAFDGAKDKYPAIAALGITEGDVRSYMTERYRKDNTIPAPEDVLAHFESEHVKKFEAAGYKKPQVEAPKAEEKKPISSKTVTADWQAGSSPTGDDNKSVSQSLKESRNEIKKKLEAGFFKRQRA